MLEKYIKLLEYIWKNNSNYTYPEKVRFTIDMDLENFGERKMINIIKEELYHNILLKFSIPTKKGSIDKYVSIEEINPTKFVELWRLLMYAKGIFKTS